MRDRKILILVGAVVLFALVVVIWYFSSNKVTPNPSAENPTNPFGQDAGVRPGGEFITNLINRFTGGSTTETEVTPASERTLISVWDKPTAGYAFITREITVDGTSTISQKGTTTLKVVSKPVKKTVEYIMFVDRITGNVYGYNKEGGAPFQITNTTVAGVHDAYIVNNGTVVFLRYADQKTGGIKTLTAGIPFFVEGADPHALVNLRSLQDNISSFAVSDTAAAYSYIVPTSYGSSIYTVSAKNVTTSVNSPLREWSLVYSGEIAYITNKASAYLEGSTFSLPNKNYILGGKTGLISLPNKTGDLVLGSMWSTSGLTTLLFSKKTGSTQTVTMQTIASKCTWLDSVKALCGVPTSIPSGDEGLPDDWYQGSVSLSDDLYMLDSGTGIVSGLYNLANDPGAPFDLTNLHTNTRGTLLGFINKQGGGLWMINLSKLISSQ